MLTLIFINVALFKSNTSATLTVVPFPKDGQLVVPVARAHLAV
ncbi:MAG: hypothetical protein P8J37_05985 [Fuerstiella sp.]|nr:hypothetical protein [Fuerstiella sp.]